MAEGGDAEGARRAWLKYHIGNAQFKKARALVVNAAEAEVVEAAFRKADIDGDGVISNAEKHAFASLDEWRDDPR